MAKTNNQAPDLNKLKQQQEGGTPPQSTTTPQKDPEISPEVLEKALKQRFGNMDELFRDLVEKEVAKRTSELTQTNSGGEIRELLDQVIKTPEAGEDIPYIKDMEKVFAEKEVGEKVLTFKTLKYKNILFPAKATMYKDGKTVEMLVTKSHESPFRHHQPEDLKQWKPLVETVQFIGVKGADYGVLYVNPNRAALQKFLLCHPKYGKEFVLEDKVAEAKSAKAGITERKKLEKKLDDMYAKDERGMRIMAVATMGVSDAMDSDKDQVYTSLYNLIHKNVDLYLSVTQEPKNAYKYYYALGLKKQVLVIRGTSLQFKGKEVVYVPHSEDPMDMFCTEVATNKELLHDITSSI